jgi:hypothetical protein
MSYDDDEYMFQPAKPRGERIFGTYDNQHHTLANINFWKGAIDATSSGDAAGMAHALYLVQGCVEPTNGKNKPRRNALAKAIFRLKTDPDAWSRLRRATRYQPFLDESDAAVSDADWMPSKVDLISYMWAANPTALGQASRAWRLSCQDSKKWWSCPFLTRAWNGPISPLSLIHHEAKRLFGRPDSDRGGDNHWPDPAPDTPDSSTEREALKRILTETARACIEQLWSSVDKDCQSRAKGKTVWGRGDGHWGLAWLYPHLDWSEPNGSKRTVGLIRQPDASALAVDDAMAEAFAYSDQAGSAMARKLSLTLFDHNNGALAIRAMSRLDAHPTARALPLPFERHDWIAPRVLAKMNIDDDALGVWLAEVGAHWSAPGLAETSMTRQSGITSGHPAWSHRTVGLGKANQPWGLDDWSLLEWITLLNRPMAARRACQLGADLHPDFEKAVEGTEGWNFPISRPEALCVAQACRIAHETRLAPTPVSAPAPMRL